MSNSETGAADTPLIVGLGGTLRARSYSRAALREVLGIAEAQGARVEMLDLREMDLPMYRPDLALEDFPAPGRSSISHLLEACRRADAMLWSTPTYHGTLSGVLKNALDYLELLADDPLPYLQGRAVGLIAVSDRMTFGAMASIAHELRAWLAPTYLSFPKSDFTADLALGPERARRRAARLAGELIGFAARRSPG